MLIAPERISIFQRVLHPSAEMKPVSELMPAAVKEITPMNAPTAMPILLMRADAFASFAGLPLEVVDGVAYHCVGDYVVDALRDAEQHKAYGGDNELPRRVIADKIHNGHHNAAEEMNDDIRPLLGEFL